MYLLDYNKICDHSVTEHMLLIKNINHTISVCVKMNLSSIIISSLQQPSCNLGWCLVVLESAALGKRTWGYFLLNPITFLLMQSLNSFGSQVEIRSVCSWNKISTVKLNQIFPTCASFFSSTMGSTFSQRSNRGLSACDLSLLKELWRD